MKQQLVEFEHRAAGSDRARRAGRGRRQQISRERSLAARRRRRHHHHRAGRGRARPDRTAAGVARAARQRRCGRRRCKRSSARPRAAATSCRPRSPAPKPASPPANGAGRCARPSANTARRPASAAPCATTSTGLDDIRADVDRVSRKLGRRLTFLVGKPGLDGHSNGAEQIAVRARDAGMQVVYEGIRLTPEEIVDAAREQKAHVVGLSVLSGSHLPLVEDVVARMKAAGLDVPVVVGGIIPPQDAAALEKAGVAAVYTPKDFELNRIMSDVVRDRRARKRREQRVTAHRAIPLAQRLPPACRGLTGLAEIEIHAGRARGGLVGGVAAAGNADHRHLARFARQRANAARRLQPVEPARASRPSARRRSRRARPLRPPPRRSRRNRRGGRVRSGSCSSPRDRTGCPRRTAA